MDFLFVVLEVKVLGEASPNHSNLKDAALKNLGEGSLAQANLGLSKQELFIAH